MSLPNALAYCGQLALVVLICAPLPRVLGLRSAAVQHCPAR